MATINLTCPQCGQIDSVRKVSTIVSDGTSSGTYSGYGDGIGYSAHGMTVMDEVITITGSSQTQLSWLLSPPIEPSKRSFFEVLLVMPFIGLLGLMFTILGLFGIVTTKSEGAGMLIFGMLCLSIVVLMLITYFHNSKDEKIRVEREIPSWKNAVYRWQQLYYCYRCDGVYLPNLDYLVPTQYVMDFLYYV